MQRSAFKQRLRTCAHACTINAETLAHINEFNVSFGSQKDETCIESTAYGRGVKEWHCIAVLRVAAESCTVCVCA